MRFATGGAAVAAIVAAVAVGSGADPASAGCGMTLELHNRSNSTVTVELADSDVRVSDWAIASWRRVGSGTRDVLAATTVRQSYLADFGCDLFRTWRIRVTQASSSWFVYEYSDSNEVHVHVEP